MYIYNYNHVIVGPWISKTQLTRLKKDPILNSNVNGNSILPNSFSLMLKPTKSLVGVTQNNSSSILQTKKVHVFASLIHCSPPRLGVGRKTGQKLKGRVATSHNFSSAFLR